MVRRTRDESSLYTKILSDLDWAVEEQLTDGDRVTSRFVVSGNAPGKEVRFNGIAISRFSDGMIVEDWSVPDTLRMLCRTSSAVPSRPLDYKLWLTIYDDLK